MKNLDRQPVSLLANEERRARRRLHNLLSRKPCTIHEAVKKLRAAGLAEPVIEQVIAEATESGWLDDQTFSRLWVEDRTANKPRGKVLLRQELRSRGVSGQIIDLAVSQADLDEEALALRAAREQLFRYQNDEAETRLRKLKNFLQRRGFSFEIIRRALKQIGESDAQ